MGHFVFFSNSIATPVPLLLFCSNCFISLLNMFWAIQQELFFMPMYSKKNYLKKDKKLRWSFLVKSLAYSIQIYWNETLRWVFSLEWLRSYFDRFFRIAIINFVQDLSFDMTYIFMKVIRNGSGMVKRELQVVRWKFKSTS